MVGNREQLLEAVIDPAKLETYGISNTSIIQTVSSNNRLIPAGQVDTGQGSFSIKVPGLIEDADDLFNSATRVERRRRIDCFRYSRRAAHL